MRDMDSPKLGSLYWVGNVEVYGGASKSRNRFHSRNDLELRNLPPPKMAESASGIPTPLYGTKW